MGSAECRVAGVWMASLEKMALAILPVSAIFPFITVPPAIRGKENHLVGINSCAHKSRNRSWKNTRCAGIFSDDCDPNGNCKKENKKGGKKQGKKGRRITINSERARGKILQGSPYFAITQFTSAATLYHGRRCSPSPLSGNKNLYFTFIRGQRYSWVHSSITISVSIAD